MHLHLKPCISEHVIPVPLVHQIKTQNGNEPPVGYAIPHCTRQAVYVHFPFYACPCVPCTYAPRVSLCMCLCVLEISKPVSCHDSRLALWKVGDWLYLGLSNLGLWKFQEIVGETEIIPASTMPATRPTWNESRTS